MSLLTESEKQIDNFATGEVGPKVHITRNVGNILVNADRIVKNIMRSGNPEGKVTQDFFGKISSPYRLVNNKVIVPTPDEQERNPRSRSAKLRIAERQ